MQNIDWSQTFLNAISNPWPILLLGGLWFAWWIYSLWDCLTRLKEPQRLTWVVIIIAVPVFGVLFYWFRGSDEGRKANRDLI